VWTLVSYLTSSTRNYGLDDVLRDAALVLVLLWTRQHTARHSDASFIRRFAFTIVLGALLAILLGVLVYALQPVSRFVGTFFDYRFHTDYWPNAWAQYLLLAWPMALLLVPEPSRRDRCIVALVLGVLVGSLLLSYSRGALIAFAGQAALFGWVEWKGSGRKSLVHVAGTLAIVATVAACMFLGINALRAQFHPVQSALQKVTFTADEGGSSVSERQQFWSQSLRLIAERPVTGWGPYSFRFVHQRLQTTVLATSDHPHNLFLKIAVERGLPAALFLLALLLPVFVVALRCLTSGALPVSHERLCLLVALLGVLAHNLIDYNLQFVGIALPFWMMLGLVTTSSSSSASHGSDSPADPMKRSELNKKFVQIFDLSVAIILLIFSLREGGFLLTSSLGRRSELRSDTAAALRWYDRSEGEWFSRDMHLSTALLSTLQGDLDRADRAMASYLEVNAEDPRGWRLKGDVARELKDLEGAVTSYREAFARGKWNDLSITLALVESLRRSDRQKEIQELKPEIDALLTSFTEAIAVNAHFVALSHNAEDAIALADALAEEFPKDAPRYEVLAAKADHAMRRERSKAKARSPGYLW
jgi:O-antigen ligase